MMTIVLVQLIYIICKVDIDDVIVHGKTPEEFLERLRIVFTRFREFKINLNPVTRGSVSTLVTTLFYPVLLQKAYFSTQK